MTSSPRGNGREGATRPPPNSLIRKVNGDMNIPTILESLAKDIEAGGKVVK